MNERKKNVEELAFRDILLIMLGSLVFMGVGYGVFLLGEALMREYVAYGYGLDPRGLVFLLGIGLFMIGLIGIVILSLIPEDAGVKCQDKGDKEP